MLGGFVYILRWLSIRHAGMYSLCIYAKWLSQSSGVSSREYGDVSVSSKMSIGALRATLQSRGTGLRRAHLARLHVFDTTHP